MLLGIWKEAKKSNQNTHIEQNSVKANKYALNAWISTINDRLPITIMYLCHSKEKREIKVFTCGVLYPIVSPDLNSVHHTFCVSPTMSIIWLWICPYYNDDLRTCTCLYLLPMWDQVWVCVSVHVHVHEHESVCVFNRFCIFFLCI